MVQFPLLTLQDIILCKNFNQKKVEIYIKECQKHNIVWIQGIITQINRIFSTNKIDIKHKVHAMYLLKQIILTCQYVTLYMVQTYLLNYIVEITEYYSNNLQLKLNSRYFQSLGCSKSYPNIEQLSHNYVTLASEILYICAFIRMKQTFQKEELKKDSYFYTAYRKIKQKNSNIYHQQQLETKYQLKQKRQKYKTQLKQFENNNYFYIDHYIKKLQNYIFQPELQQQQPNQLDFKLLFKHGDTYLTSEAIARLSQAIDFVDDFKIKNRSLSMINEFVFWGDIQAIIAINFTQYFQKIIKKIGKVDGEKGFKQGVNIYPQIKNQSQEKKKFYTDFLRCLAIWALNFPNQQTIFYQATQKQILSPINKHYKNLLQQRKFIFPQNLFLQKIQIQIRQNLRTNSQRNKCILNEFSKQVNTIQMSYTKTFKQIKAHMNQAKKCLIGLKKSNQLSILDGTMQYLIEFSKRFQLELQRLEENVDSEELDETIEKGLVCIQLINVIQPKYHKLKDGPLALKQFVQYCRKKIDEDYFSGKRNQLLNDVSINSSKSLIDRKSQIKNNINSNLNRSRELNKSTELNKSRDLISKSNLDQKSKLQNMRSKYLQRLQKLANRTNSQRDDSFLNTSAFLNTSSSNNKTMSRLPLHSRKHLITDLSQKSIKQVKSQDKLNLQIPRSPRQNGKKVFVVSKYVQNEGSETLSKIKQKINQSNWNSKKSLPVVVKKQTIEDVFQKQKQFSFVDKNVVMMRNQSNIQKENFIKEENAIKSTSQNSNALSRQGSNQLFRSPVFGNTSIKVENQLQTKRKPKKGVGLAKKFIKLTQKLIGPILKIITFQSYPDNFKNYKDTQTKTNILSKQKTILQNDQLRIDRVSIISQKYISVYFYVFPKANISHISIQIIQTPSIYLNIIQSQYLYAQTNFYKIKDLKPNQQYQIQFRGVFLKAPMIFPQILIKIGENHINQSFMIPFPMIYLCKYIKPQHKWLGKDYELLPNKIISCQFNRKKEILSTFSDIDDYIGQLVQIKEDKAIKRYRTHVKLDKTNFILQVKQIQNKMTIETSLIDSDCDTSNVQFLIAQCIHLFS